MPDSNWRMGPTYSWTAGSTELGSNRIGFSFFKKKFGMAVWEELGGEEEEGVGRECEIPPKWAWDEVWDVEGDSNAEKCAEHEYVGLSFGFAL